jgi:hypothetical protein
MNEILTYLIHDARFSIRHIRKQPASCRAASGFPRTKRSCGFPQVLQQGEFTIEGGRVQKWLHMVARLSPNVTSQKMGSGSV